jgi:hypothetical protein
VIPQPAVAAERRRLEVRLRVDAPPLDPEVGEQLLGGVELRQRPELLAPPDLRLEVLGSDLRSKTRLLCRPWSRYRTSHTYPCLRKDAADLVAFA